MVTGSEQYTGKHNGSEDLKKMCPIFQEINANHH